LKSENRDNTNRSYDYPIKGCRAKSYFINGSPQQPKVIDHIFKNSHIVSELKSTEFERAKKEIDYVYDHLGVHKITNGEFRRLTSISNFIPFNIK